MKLHLNIFWLEIFQKLKISIFKKIKSWIVHKLSTVKDGAILPALPAAQIFLSLKNVDPVFLKLQIKYRFVFYLFSPSPGGKKIGEECDNYNGESPTSDEWGVVAESADGFSLSPNVRMDLFPVLLTLFASKLFTARYAYISSHKKMLEKTLVPWTWSLKKAQWMRWYPGFARRLLNCNTF